MTLPWVELIIFAIAVGLLALYGLTFSGHFPAEFRNPQLRGGLGAAILWGTLITACLAAVVVFGIAAQTLSWPSIVIGSGAMLLATPLLLRPFPDWFVNGPASLLIFAAGGFVFALCLWAIS